MKANTLLVIAAVASMLIASPYVMGLLTHTTLNTSGVMAEIDLGVYSDDACTQPLSEINWGTCYPEVNSTATIYIKNLGTVATTLSISTDNWTPANAASHYLLYASCEGYILTAGEVIETSFNLKPLASAYQFDTFSFNIHIQGHD
jgi:hypothetical protein